MWYIWISLAFLVVTFVLSIFGEAQIDGSWFVKVLDSLGASFVWAILWPIAAIIWIVLVIRRLI